MVSAAHVTAPPGGVDYAALDARAPRDSWLEYGESKWADIALAKYVHSAYGPQCQDGVCALPAGEVISIAVHPGVVATNLFMHNAVARWLCHNLTWAFKLVSHTAATGALNQIWAAEVGDGEARELSGKYVWCFQCRGVERGDLHDPAAWKRVWDWCEAQVARQE